MASDPLLLLRTTPLFSSCRDEDLTEIASQSRFRSLDSGAVIFRTGDTADRLYIVHSGEVVVRKDDNEGRSVDIARFLPGDCFGELDMFTGTPRNASAYADGPVSLLCFPCGPRGFEELSDISDGASARLLHSFLVQVSSRIRDINVLVKENSPVVQNLKKQVYVDKLTGLYNKTFFDETLEKTLGNGDAGLGLLMYKPDNFKAVNDGFGHDAGDKVLRYIADRLREFVPDGDMLFRYMGNENAVIMPGAGRDELKELAGSVGDFLRSLNLGTVLEGYGISLSVSFGLAVCPQHGRSAAELVEAAHPLTLEGRRRGGNLVLFPEDSLETGSAGGTGSP